MTGGRAIALYEARAKSLRARYDGVSTDEVLAGVADLLPPPPAPVLDVGAGSGRDAEWFARRGHPVCAAEPVAAFRQAIATRVPEADVTDAGLPALEGIKGPFGLILVNAVWQHLTAPERDTGLARLHGLLAPAGRLVLSLRHGPVPEGQPVFLLDAGAEGARGEAAGLRLLRCREAPSHQAANIAAGVRWTWLVFEKEQPE